MTAEIVKGYDGFTQTHEEMAWSLETGWATVKTYEGPQSGKEAYCNGLIQQGALNLKVGTGVPCIIIASFPAEFTGWNADAKAQEEAVWELIGEPIEKRLESHGKFANSTSAVPILEEIEKAITDGKASDTDWDAAHTGLGEFNKYRNLRILGVDSYQSYMWRVRCTWTVSKISLLKAPFVNVGKVVAWSKLNVPAKAQFSQPTLHYCKQLSGGTYTDDLIDQWLVQPPTVTWRKGQRKWNIVQEWLGMVEWSGTLYDGGTASP